jgi:hypothetical protein
VTAGIKAEIDRATADSGVRGSKKNYKNNSNTVSDKLIRTTLILIVKTQNIFNL